MADIDPEMTPVYTAEMNKLLYKGSITRKELECLPKWNTKALIGTLYRWDETRAIVQESPIQFRLMRVEE